MQYLEDELRQITEDVWTMILGLEVHPTPSPRPPDADGLRGTVRIQGGWDGELRLVCPSALARRATAIMFGTGEDEVAPDQTQDAIGELTNMLGGNVKAILPGPSTISLPEVRPQEPPASGDSPGGATTTVHFQCNGQAFAVVLWQPTPAAAVDS